MTDYVNNIRTSGLSINDLISPDDERLFIPTTSLEKLLSDSLIGLSLNGLPLRTRSKVVKTAICEALGYPVPTSFKKTQPRFIGQNFDVYTQKSLNVQIWNEEVDESRRYVFLRANQDDVITHVRIITGDELVQYDRTGTLTQKYQARMNSYSSSFCSQSDSPVVEEWISDHQASLERVNPNQIPNREQLMRIAELYEKLTPIVGQSVSYIDATQERNRGAELHALICSHLGYSHYEDDGFYPDITNQLLEVKLQTSPTIDLGRHSPEDGKTILCIGETCFQSKDIRYAIFDGQVHENSILLRHLNLVTGTDFSSYFPLFQGKVTNTKIQLPLPSDFFD